MDWSTFRTSHLSQYGSSSRSQLSKDYQDYKKSLRSPPRRQSPKLQKVKLQNNFRSPAKAINLSKSTIFEIEPKRMASPKKLPKRIASPKKDLKMSPKRNGYKPLSKKVTIKDIEGMAADKKFLIVVLYADWCGHCKDMKEKLGNKMKNTDKIVFYESENMDNLTDYYPRVMYFENGERQRDLNLDNVFDYFSL